MLTLTALEPRCTPLTLVPVRSADPWFTPARQSVIAGALFGWWAIYTG